MQRFVHNENLKRFRELLAQESDPIKRQQIERLLREERVREVDQRKNATPKQQAPKQ